MREASSSGDAARRRFENVDNVLGSCDRDRSGDSRRRALLRRQADGRVQSLRLVGQGYISAVVADNGPGNGKAEAYASCFAVSRIFHPEEWRKNLLLGAVGNAGSIIGDDNLDTVCSPLHADARPLAITDGIFDEVSACAAECFWPAAVADLLSIRERDVMTEFGEVVAETFHECREVHGTGIF